MYQRDHKRGLSFEAMAAVAGVAQCRALFTMKPQLRRFCTPQSPSALPAVDFLRATRPYLVPRRNIRQPRSSEPNASNRMIGSEEEYDFDNIQLDDNYYRELGISSADAADEQQWSASDADPEGVDLDYNRISGLAEDVPEHLRGFLEGTEDLYGPQAMVMAGFRAEEYAMVCAACCMHSRSA